MSKNEPMTDREPDDVSGERGQLEPRSNTVRARVGRWPLFGKIAVWAMFSTVVLIVLTQLWGVNIFSRGAMGRTAGPLELVRLALTILGGIGAVGYLVIKYQDRQAGFREEAQRNTEIQLHRQQLTQAEEIEDHRQEEARRARLDAQVAQAIAMLGDRLAASIRIAGVYALADIADQEGGMWRQRVVDILCGYLRTARHDIIRNEETAKVTRVVAADGPVESTILVIIARHLRKRRPVSAGGRHLKLAQDVDDDQLWCDCEIDLHSAVLTEPVNWGGITLTGNIDMRRVHFTQRVTFESAHLAQGVDFESATFEEVDFTRATFVDVANFMDAQFQRAKFSESHFEGDARFQFACFDLSAEFTRVRFDRTANFNHTKFLFSGDFSESNFRGTANFMGVVYEFGLAFTKSVFLGGLELLSSAREPSFFGAQLTRGKVEVWHSSDQATYGPDSSLPSGASWISESQGLP